jgi:hypothetical protein
MTNIDNYVTDVLMRDLVGHDRRPVSFLVYLWLAAEEARKRSGADQLSGACGIDWSFKKLGASVREVAHTQEASGGEQRKCDGDSALHGA